MTNGEANTCAGVPVQESAGAPLSGTEDVSALLQRFVSLVRSGELGDLLAPPLDVLLTAEQAAKWMQVNPQVLNTRASRRQVPAVQIGKQWRFHPRTILEEGHRKYFAFHGIKRAEEK